MQKVLNNKVRETHRDINIIWDVFVQNIIICPQSTSNNKDHYFFGRLLFTISSPNNIDNLKVKIQKLIYRYSEYKN